MVNTIFKKISYCGSVVMFYCMTRYGPSCSYVYCKLPIVSKSGQCVEIFVMHYPIYFV